MLSAGTPVEGDTSQGSNALAASCGGGDSPEAIWLLDWPSAGDVTLTTAGSAFDTVLYVLSGCSAGTGSGLGSGVGVGDEIACNDDSGSGVASGSTIALSALAPGRYWVVVDGFGGASGTYKLTLE
jgi:hypothetical protein